jgi:2-dehydro-3-deoxygluconokinase
MTRIEDHARAINLLAEWTPTVVVKHGGAASVCRSGSEEWSALPPRVAVVDDVGAGDSFAAGFIHQYLRGGDLRKCLAYANLAGAYSTTKEGGTEAFRDRDGLATFLRTHSPEPKQE